MSEHSVNCGAVNFEPDEDGGSLCNCGLDAMVGELKLLREVETMAQLVSMNAVGGPESGARPGEQLVTNEAIDDLRRALSALDTRRKDHG